MSDDRINAMGRGVFNAPGQLFNSDDPVSSGVRRYVQALPPDPGTETPTVTRPKRFTTFGPQQPREVAEADPVPHVQPVVGCMAAVRAARIAHQHRNQVWGRDVLIGLVAASDTPDPTPDQIEQMYSDLQLFTYLPSNMLPSRTEFEDMVRPQRRQALVESRLTDLGIAVQAQPVSTPLLVDEEVANDELLPAQVPFSESNLNSCGT